MSGRASALQAIALVARALDDLRDDVVFVGGAVAALYADDNGNPIDFRITDDIDCIVGVHTVAAYHDLTAALRARGFKEDDTPDAPRCRFRLGTLIVDVMPTSQNVLGFTNRWFEEALRASDEHTLDGLRIRVIKPVHFIATKLVAFADRGGGDFFASHDLEDAVTVMDALRQVRDEIATGTERVHDFIRAELRRYFKLDAFRDSVFGHLAGDDRRSDRLLMWLETL